MDSVIIVVLVSLIMGAVAGAVAAAVVVEVKTEEFSTVIHTIKTNVENLAEITHIQNETAQSTTNMAMGINTALQEFITKYKADKIWMMQSLNDLWKDYDERHPKEVASEDAVEVKPIDEKVATPKKTRRRKQAEEEQKGEAKPDDAE
jgi:patatin-like phospholipase/acyl hydrolase